MENRNSFNKTMQHSLKINELSRLSAYVKEKAIWFHTIELEYRKKNQMLLVRFTGARNMVLADKYVQVIEEQLNILQNSFITPLIRQVRANFHLSLSVNAKGLFSFSDTSLTLKVDCGAGITMQDSFREPFAKILPFSAYITYLEFRGNQNRIAVVESTLKITPEELENAITCSSVSHDIRKQWFHIASRIYKEAKEEYRYNVSIPCIDGEMYWDNKIDTIQYNLYDKEQRMRVL
jgi:hypothetical protein